MPRRMWLMLRVLLGWLLLAQAGIAQAAPPLRLWYEKYELNHSLEQLLRDYRKSTGQSVIGNYVPTSDLRNTSIRAVVQGTAPDMMLVPSDFIGSRGLLQLSRLEPELIDALDPRAQASVTSRDGVYGVPLLFGNHLMLMYNNRLVEQPATSWQQILEQKAAAEARGARIIGWKVTEMYWLIPFLTAFDAAPVVDGKLHLNTPQMTKALSFYRQQLDDGLINPRCNYECSHELFADGIYAYSINGDWALHALRARMGTKLSLAPLPEINGHAMRPYTGSIALVFPNNSLNGPNSTALLNFARYLLSDEAQRQLLKGGALLAVNTTVLAEQLAKLDDNGRARMAQIAQSEPMPPEPEMAAAWIGLNKGFMQFMRRRVEPEVAAALMQDVAEQELLRLNAH